MRNSKKGFTLVELLIVLAIIGILMVIALSVIPNVMANSRDKNRQSTAKSFLTALGTIKASEGGSYVPASQPGGSELTGDVNGSTGNIIYGNHLQSYLDKALNQQIDKKWNTPFVYATDYFTNKADIENDNNQQGNYYQIAYRSEIDKKAHVFGDFRKSTGADATVSSYAGKVATVDTVDGWKVGDVAFVKSGTKIKGMGRILDIDTVNKTLTFEQNPKFDDVATGRDNVINTQSYSDFIAVSDPAVNDKIVPATGLIFGYKSEQPQNDAGLSCVVLDNTDCYPYR